VSEKFTEVKKHFGGGGGISPAFSGSKEKQITNICDKGSNALYPRKIELFITTVRKPLILHGVTSVSPGSSSWPLQCSGCDIGLCKDKHFDYEQEEYHDNIKRDSTGSTVSFSQLSITNQMK
jgi:hypothetical protein